MDLNIENSTSSVRLEHVAIVVRDLEKAISLLSLLGVKPLPSKDITQNEITFKGKIIEKWLDTVKVIHASMGPIGLEIFVPQGGDTIYNEFLNKTGGGIHHFAYVADDLDSVLYNMIKAGARVVSTSRRLTREKPHAYYIESDMAPGVIIELSGKEIHPFEFK